MKIPSGMTEGEIVTSVERVLDTLAKQYAFGIWGEDDIRQYGWEEVLKLLEQEKYDTARPFENLVYSHLKNRFLNLWRNKLTRNDPPCSKCHVGDAVACTGSKEPCRKYQEWKKRNSTKANLQRPLDISNISDEHELATREDSTVVEDVAEQELLRLIDAKLPVDMRRDYLLIRAGEKVSKAKRTRVEETIRDIIGWENEDQ